MITDQQDAASELERHGELARRAPRRLVDDHPVERARFETHTGLSETDAGARDPSSRLGEQFFAIAMSDTEGVAPFERHKEQPARARKNVVRGRGGKVRGT